VTPEMIVELLAVFISGGALGASGTLLGQWVLKRIQGEAPPKSLGSGDIDLLRGDVAELSRKLQQVDIRLDFTEQLLGGALPISRPELARDFEPDSRPDSEADSGPGPEPSPDLLDAPDPA
jgi:hypothetical protein